MRKSKKNFLGLLGLAFVALMTVVAYCLPTNGAYAEGASAGVDTLRVTVYDQFPSVTVDDPEMDDIYPTSDLGISFTYQNSTYVDFTLSYVDEEGNPQTIPLERFNPDPSRLDPTYNYDSDSNSITVDLSTYGLKYNRYTLTAVSSSPIGPSTGDSVEFYYIPAEPEQKKDEEGTNNPVVDIEYDKGVVKIEIMPVDENGNNLFDDPVVVDIPAPYDGGTTPVTLPFTSYGLGSGDYDIVVTSYRLEENEEGELELVVAPTPIDTFKVSYVQPLAPDVPNTGRFLNGLNSAKSDYVMAIIIAFVGIAIIALVLVNRKKKEHCKNTRSRR